MELLAQRGTQAFPFHQGRFQGRAGLSPGLGRWRVSIPPRKVSRGRRRTISSRSFRAVSIPPRKVSRGGSPSKPRPTPGVSIPPRKVSREKIDVLGPIAEARFHSTKEGFKVCSSGLNSSYQNCFHSTKEGFKGNKIHSQRRKSPCFHSTKEGFKGLGQSPVLAQR